MIRRVTFSLLILKPVFSILYISYYRFKFILCDGTTFITKDILHLTHVIVDI